MKNYIYKTLLVFFISLSVFSQSPDWRVNENNFQYTMSMEGFINVDGKILNSVNDKVAAFVNGECRGATNLLYVASENKYVAYLTIFANVDEETVSFKIYNSETNSIRNVDKTKVFENNKHFGNLFQGYSFANPALSDAVEVLDVNFENITLNGKTILGSDIVLFVNEGTKTTNLNLLFQLSPGAKMYLGTTNQTAPLAVSDFNKPIQFQVLSQDQSVLKQWTVTVKTGGVSFYKKDAVCYTGGVIKVVFEGSGLSAILSKDGNVLTTQPVLNGETVFNNLSAGTYSVNVGAANKEIVINQKI